MNHPTQEEWMTFLYGEGPLQARHEWKRHLASCAACQQTVRKWREVMGGLTAWRIDGPANTQGRRFPWVKAVAVALLAIGLGFVAGLWAEWSGPNAQQLRAQLEPEIRAGIEKELAKTLARQFSADWQSALDKTRAQIGEDLRQYQSQQLSAYALLRHDLENLAVATETAIGRTYQQLGQLTSYNQMGNESIVPVNNSNLKMP